MAQVATPEVVAPAAAVEASDEGGAAPVSPPTSLPVAWQKAGLTERPRDTHSAPPRCSVATTLIGLGLAYGRFGDKAKARDMLERALAIFESAYGPDHPHREGCQKLVEALAELSSA